MDAQKWIREHLLLDAHCDSLVLRLRRDDPLDLADVDPVYQVDLPRLRRGGVDCLFTMVGDSDLAPSSLLIDAAYDLNNQCPLGSAASYGVPLPIDRQMTSDLLGFAKPQNNVLYANDSRIQALCGYYAFGETAFPASRFSATACSMKPSGAMTCTLPDATSSAVTTPLTPPQWSAWVWL